MFATCVTLEPTQAYRLKANEHLTSYLRTESRKCSLQGRWDDQGLSMGRRPGSGTRLMVMKLAAGGGRRDGVPPNPMHGGVRGWRPDSPSLLPAAFAVRKRQR